VHNEIRLAALRAIKFRVFEPDSREAPRGVVVRINRRHSSGIVLHFRAHRRCHVWIALLAMLWLNFAPLIGAAAHGAVGWSLLGTFSSHATSTHATDAAPEHSHAGSHAAQTRDVAPLDSTMHHGSARCPLCVLGSAMPLPIDARVVLALLPHTVALLVPANGPIAHATHVGTPPPPRAPPRLP
jgi:hypothetical protein